MQGVHTYHTQGCVAAYPVYTYTGGGAETGCINLHARNVGSGGMGFSGDPHSGGKSRRSTKMPGFHHYGDPRYIPYHQIRRFAHEPCINTQVAGQYTLCIHTQVAGQRRARRRPHRRLVIVGVHVRRVQERVCSCVGGRIIPFLVLGFWG